MNDRGIGGRLPGDGRKRLNAENHAIRGKSQCFRGDQPNAQAGVASRTAADDDGGQLTRVPVPCGEQFLHERGEVARMPARFLKVPNINHPVASGKGDVTLAVGGFDNQEAFVHRGRLPYIVPMTTSPEYLIHTDGAARGNPGPAAFAYVIEAPGQAAIEEKGYLGETTNNIAEYTGLVRALQHAQRLGARRLLVQSDSELIVNQMNGAFKVKHPGLLPLYREADELRRNFDEVTLRHIRREHNKRADRLCNEALDSAAGIGKSSANHAERAAPAPPVADDPKRRDLERLVRDDTLACLRAGAAAWSRGEDAELRPEDVWDQLWSILVEAGVLRKKR